MTTSWAAVLAVLAGLGLTGFGMRILVTGRAPLMIIRSFRTVRDAGRYHLLFGLGLLLLVTAARVPGDLTGTAAGVLAIVLVAVAVIRYRPRGRRDPEG